MSEKGVFGISAETNFKKYFFWVFVFGMVFLSYKILKPYIISLISAFILAYLVRPVYSKLEKKMGGVFAAIISIVLIVFIIIIPFILVAGGVTQQIYIYFSSGAVSEFINSSSSSPLFQRFGVDLGYIAEKVLGTVSVAFKDFAVYIPYLLLSVLITLFGMFYILLNWDFLADKLKNFIPFENRAEISEEISKKTNVLVYGTLLIAFMEFFIAVAGFYFAGTRFYLLLASVVFIAAFIPGIGPAFVWAPLAIYYLVIGKYLSFTIVLITGLILTLAVDLVFRSKLLGKKSKLNPLLMLLGILGGVAVFGIFGFIIGPLILIYTIELLEEGLGNS